MSTKQITAILGDWQGCRIGTVGRFEAGVRGPTAQVDQRMQFDGGFLLSELRPWKQRQAQIDRRGIERVSRLIQLNAEVVAGVEFSGDPDQSLRKVGVDAPVSLLVCVGQCGATDLAADSHVIPFGSDGAQTRFDIAQALAEGKLTDTVDLSSQILHSVQNDK